LKQYIKILIFFLIIVAQMNFLFAQHADCATMLVLEDTIYHAKNVSGYGKVVEFSGNDLDDKKVFEEENNSIWYLITIPARGELAFDIETDNVNDDWDFLLYSYKSDFCERIAQKTILPIRTNLSRSPKTGLSNSATKKLVGAGINENYSSTVQVYEDEKYVLVVNNPKRKGGSHTLYLHLPKKIKEKQVAIKSKVSSSILFSLTIKDSGSKNTISSNAIISGVQQKNVELINVTNYETSLSRKNHTILVNAHAKGYMLLSEEFKVSKNKVKASFEILLEKIEKGKKVNLKKIQFYGNRADFLPIAKGSLLALLDFMKQNEKVAIEIEGHVNGPGKRNTKDYQNLSYSRALAVKSYLVKNGIEKDRIDYKGYGNSKMLYPKPKSEYQESSNRRVEIKIISNDFNSGNRNFH